MFSKKITSPIALLTLIIFACACGSKSSDEKTVIMNNDEESRRTYKLYPDNYLSDNYREHYNLNGYDEKGNQVSATFNINLSGKSKVNGKPSFFTEQSIDLFFNNGSTKHRRIVNKTTLAKIITTRIYPDDNDINKPNENTHLTLPNASEVGSYGTLFNTTDIDGVSEITYWSLDETDGIVKLILETKIKKESRLQYYEKVSFQINQKGERINLVMEIEYPNDNLKLSFK